MNRFKCLRINRNLLSLSIILSGFIMGFYILNSVYSYRNEEWYLEKINKEFFKNELSKDEQKDFEVDKITKFTLPNNVEEYDFLDINTIAFTCRDISGKLSSSSSGIYDLAKNSVISNLYEEKYSIRSTISISNDSRIMINSFLNEYGGISKIYIYDISNEREICNFNGIYQVAWLPNNHEFVGIDNYLFVYDIKSGSRRNLLQLDEFQRTPSKVIGEFKLSSDGKFAYMRITYVDSCLKSTILRVNVENGEKVERNNNLFAINPLNDKNAIVLTEGDNNYGMYMYDFENNYLKQLISAEHMKIGDISISLDNKKVAYMLAKEDGIDEIHVAYLDKDGLRNDQVIYQDSQIVEKIRWSRDGKMLYFKSNNNGTLYRILFKNI